jgi:hypothetical protein
VFSYVEHIRKLSVAYRVISRVSMIGSFDMLKIIQGIRGQESEAEPAGDCLPVPYPSAFEIFRPVRFKSGKNFISCFVFRKDSTAVRARAAST